MKLKINLSYYSLNYLFGSRVFQDRFLLSREMIKKAYQEKLYCLCPKKGKKESTITVFAGIPTFSEVCMEKCFAKTIHALKIALNYEELANFKQEGAYLVSEIKEISNCEKITLSLVYKDHLEYMEGEIMDDLESKKEEILKDLIKELKEYQYGMKKELEYLEKRLTYFLNQKESNILLEDQKMLQEIKEIYEMLFFVNM